MSPIELCAMRKLLLMSAADAAQHIGHGCAVQSWYRYERGIRPIPRHIEIATYSLLAQRNKYLDKIKDTNGSMSLTVHHGYAFRSAVAQWKAEAPRDRTFIEA